MPTTSPIAGVIGGGGYASASTFALAKQLSTYTTTTQNYFGVYHTTVYYNMQSQIYWDLSSAIPEGSIITSAKITLYLNWTTSPTAATVAIYRDAWGAPGWSTVDMEVETTLDNYSPIAELYVGTPTDGNHEFTVSESGITYLNSIVNTATELEVTVTDNCWVENVDPSGRKSYGYIDGAVEDLELTYITPHDNPIMMGCNI